MNGAFEAGERLWRQRLGTLRQVVRQELVGRQLGHHLDATAAPRVLDVGCGQGTQLLQLARRGHQVIGLDSSPALLAQLERALTVEPAEVRERVRVIRGDAGRLKSMFAPGSFDAVLCQGVLMYFTDPQPLLTAIGQLVVPGGLVSVVVRNGDALALRPGLLGDWPAARDGFDAPGYLNRLGVRARSDRRRDLDRSLEKAGLS